MALANRYTGSAMALTINDIAIAADYKSLAIKESVNSAEGTAGGDAHEYSVPTYGASSISVELLGVTSADGDYSDIQSETTKGATGDLVWGPEGDAEGSPRFTATGYVESRDQDIKFDDMVSLKFTYKCTADIVEDTWPAP